MFVGAGCLKVFVNLFETGLNGVCTDIRIWKVRTLGNKRRRPIDSNVINARKCLEVKKYKILYGERTWNICGMK